MIANQLYLAAVALAASASVSAGDMAGGVDFHPAFSPAAGLTLAVQNYSKLAKTVDAVDIFIGGDAKQAGCHVAVPGLKLGPAERSSVVVATAAVVNGCVGAAGARTLTRQLPMLARASGAAPGTAEAAQPLLRIAPRLDGVAAAEPMLFRIGMAVLPPQRRPIPK